MVKNYGCPNSMGARVPVPSGLDIKAWHRVLQGYDITNLSEYLMFGLPLGVYNELFSFTKFENN